MGCTANPTLLEFARRGEASHASPKRRSDFSLDDVSNLMLPVLPTSAAMPIQSKCVDILPPTADCTAIPLSAAHPFTPTTVHIIASPHTSADKSVEEACLHPEPLPPLAFRSTTTSGGHPATSVVHCRSDKTASGSKGVAGHYQKRHGLIYRFRALSMLFRATTTAAALSNALPTPSAPSNSEKSTLFHSSEWESSDPVVFHVQLPA